MTAHIRGSIVAIVTPMQPDGSLDLPCLNKLLEWHIASGTNAVVIVGTTGESATLSTDEHCDLVAHCVNVVDGRIPVIAGTGSNNTAEALYFTESAKNNGADAALLVPASCAICHAITRRARVSAGSWVVLCTTPATSKPFRKGAMMSSTSSA